jgi:PilZ domain-containing protein
MEGRDRRRETRIDMQIPLRFRPLGNSIAPEQKAESTNVSPLGLYFTTDFPLTVGSLIVVWMKLPAALTAGEPRDVRCVGRVVHVEPTGRLVRQVGVGLRIEQSEYGANVVRWAS